MCVVTSIEVALKHFFLYRILKLLGVYQKDKFFKILLKKFLFIFKSILET